MYWIEEKLTVREFEVLRLRASNYDTQEIADKLAIRPKTAIAHLRNARARLGVQFSRSSDLMVLFLREGILSIAELHLPPSIQIIVAKGHE